MKNLFYLFIFLPTLNFAQNNSIDLFSGAKITNYGLSYKEIQFEINDDTWTSNRVNLGKEFKIEMIKPTGLGFNVENGNCYPGIALLMLKPNGDTVANIPNYYTFSDGLDVATMSNLSLTLNFTEPFKAGDSVVLTTTFYDTKGENKTEIENLMIFTDSIENTNTSKSIYTSRASYSYDCASTFEIGDISNSSDTIINKVIKTVSAKGLGLEINEFKSGTESIQVYDQKMIEIKDPTIIKCLGIEITKNEEKNDSLDAELSKTISKSQLNISVAASIKKISKKYYIVYRWESLDKGKVFVLKNPFNF